MRTNTVDMILCSIRNHGLDILDASLTDLQRGITVEASIDSKNITTRPIHQFIRPTF